MKLKVFKNKYDVDLRGAFFVGGSVTLTLLLIKIVLIPYSIGGGQNFVQSLSSRFIANPMKTLFFLGSGAFSEEFLFRSWLVGSANYLHFYVGIFATIVFLTSLQGTVNTEFLFVVSHLIAFAGFFLLVYRRDSLGLWMPVKIKSFEKYVFFVFLSSTIFSLAHLPGLKQVSFLTTFISLLNVFLLGVAFSCCRIYSGLLQSFALHLGLNLLTLFTLNIDVLVKGDDLLLLSLFPVIISVIISIGFLEVKQIFPSKIEK
jgi:hypothetical protein